MPQAAADASAARATTARSENVSLVSRSALGNLSDAAFWGDIAVVGSGHADADAANDGFVLVDVDDPEAPTVLSTFRCPGSGYDVSIWKHLVVVSVSVPVSGAECSAVHPAFRPPESLRAHLLVVDVANPRAPRLIGAVDSPCPAAHTHTLLPDEDNRRLIVYNSSGPCVAVVEIPIERPWDIPPAQPLATRPIGGVAGGPAVRPSCHDITIFVPERIAACATSAFQSAGDGTQVEPDAGTELWDVTDPFAPTVLSRIQNPVMEHQHSTAFSWDGDTLVIGEEKVSTLLTETSTCGTGTPFGALWFYDVSDPSKPQVRSWFQLPRPSIDGACTAHNFSVVPLSDGRDVLTSAWYSGGTSVIDFSDPAKPEEIAYFKAEVGDRKNGSIADSAYWYNGFIYVTNFAGGPLNSNVFLPARGLDVLKVDDLRLASAVNVPYLNPQTQLNPFVATHGPSPSATTPAPRPAWSWNSASAR